MAISLNQFNIAPQLGDYAALPANPMEQVKASAALTVAVPVKITGVAGDMTTVAQAGVTDKAYGVVVYNPNKDSYVANEVVSLATANDIVYMQSTAAAISAGGKVEFDADGLVLASAGTNTILGIALTSVPAAGGLVKVKITAPYALS